MISAALAGSAAGLPADAALFGAVSSNKVVWLCLVIAALHIWREGSAVTSSRDLAIAAPALGAAALTLGAWPWIGLALSLSLWLRSAGPAARAGLLLALAVAIHEVSVGVLGELAGDALLALDARVAAVLCSLLTPDLVSSGTALHAEAGQTLILVWGCSSFANLGQTLLLCWALLSLLGDIRVNPAGTRHVLWLGLLGMLTIAANAIRLALMASSEDAYAYLHEGPGGSIYRITLIALAGAVCLLCMVDARIRSARRGERRACGGHGYRPCGSAPPCNTGTAARGLAGSDGSGVR
jgi:hypothetical protein